MILKGSQRASGRDLALHLLNVEDNEHAVVHELRGFVAEDLLGAFQETEAIALGTKCQQYLFSLSLNPPPDQDVPVAVFEQAIADIEAKLGLSGQPRAIILHEKKARRHAHAVWSRIDVEKMRAINLPHFKQRLQEVARELYRTHGWEMPAGFERKADRDPNSFDRIEAAQAKTAQRDPKALKTFFRKAWERSDSPLAFAAALREEGFELAQGTRRAFVAVDAAGKAYSLSRWTGVGAKAVRQRLGSIDTLPTIEEAQQMLQGVSTQTELPDAVEIEELTTRHREEREALLDKQRLASLASLGLRQHSFPRGLKAVWAKLTGQYQQKLEALIAAHKEERLLHRKELDELIARQLGERRSLKATQDHQLALDALMAETAGPLAKDRRQHLVLPDQDPLPSIAEVEMHPEVVLDHLSAKSESFTDNDLSRTLAKIYDDPVWCVHIRGRLATSPELVSLSSDGEARFTTRSFQKAQQSVIASASHLAENRSFAVSDGQRQKAIAKKNGALQTIGAALSEEQIKAISHLTNASALSCVVGIAGAGKSTILDVARYAWEAEGYQVFGAALAGKAADGLEAASGIKSRTLASLEKSWELGYEPIASGSLVVIDEIGMVGTRQMDRVMRELAKRHCKVVLVGDPDQLQPIEAGTPFRDILALNEHAKLQEVRRQQADWQREASINLANGNVAQAIKTYDENGCVYQAQKSNDAIAKLAADYLKTDDRPGSQLALAHRRKDVFAINQAIRLGRIKAGKLEDEILAQTDHGPRAFSVGDRVLFTKNEKGMGVRNGMLGEVTGILAGSLRIKLDDTERIITVDPSSYRALDHGYAVSIHKSQGCTVDRTFVHAGKTMDQHLTYVALTRHRAEMKLYDNTAFKKRPKQVSIRRSPVRRAATRDF